MVWHLYLQGDLPPKLRAPQLLTLFVKRSGRWLGVFHAGTSMEPARDAAERYAALVAAAPRLARTLANNSKDPVRVEELLWGLAPIPPRSSQIRERSREGTT